MLEELLLGRRGTARQSHREWAEERNRLQVYEETGVTLGAGAQQFGVQLQDWIMVEFNLTHDAASYDESGRPVPDKKLEKIIPFNEEKVKGEIIASIHHYIRAISLRRQKIKERTEKSVLETK